MPTPSQLLARIRAHLHGPALPELAQTPRSVQFLLASLTTAIADLDAHLSAGRTLPEDWRAARLEGLTADKVTPDVLAHYMDTWGARVRAVHERDPRNAVTRAVCACGAPHGGPVASELCGDYGRLRAWGRVATENEGRDGWLHRARVFLAVLVDAEEAEPAVVERADP